MLAETAIPKTADVVVIGGGCIGASVALHLAEHQIGNVVLLEQKDLAHGASGKGIGIIRTHYTHPALAQLAYESLQLFHHFPERFGGYDAGFNPCGYFILVGDSDVGTLSHLVAQHQALGINVQRVSSEDVAAIAPLVTLEDVAAIAYEPDSGYGSPSQTTIALAKRSIDLGVTVHTQTPVQAVKRDPTGKIASVVTPKGEIATRTVVDCVGPWARQFALHLGLEFPVMPVVEHVVVMERPTAVAPFHPVLSDLINLCYIRSDADQAYTRIGNSDPKYHQQFALPNADQFQGQQFPGICDELQQKLLRRCPVLEQGSLVETYAGIWGVTPDYQPIIDALKEVPGLYCAVGFSGHGYKLSPVIGDLVSQMVTGAATHTGNPQRDRLHLFRLSRFAENDLVKAPVSYSQARGLR